jgi:MFS family permease
MVSIKKKSFNWKIRPNADMSAQDPSVVLQSLGFTYGMFVGARFFIGFGVAIAHGASPLLITELVHPQHRAVYTAIYNTTWYIGSLVAAWLTFGESQCKYLTPSNNAFVLNLWQVPIKSMETGPGERHRSCKSFLLLFK